MSHGSKKAVLVAIASNSLVTVLKFGAGAVTGSASMINEAVHSLMDTLNQAFLFAGLVAAKKPADQDYAFGHGQKQFLWNLWSAIGLFSIGAGLGLAHAWHAWHAADAVNTGSVSVFGYLLHPAWVSAIVLGIALVLEGYSFFIAFSEFRRRMAEEGQDSVIKYIADSDDPTLVAVVLEDSVAMLGLLLAATGIGLSMWTGSPYWDVGFSAAIAVLLGTIAIFLGMVNARYLTDIRDADAEACFRAVVCDHEQVERYHDLRSIILGEGNSILVAEVELREEAMVAGLREQIDAKCQQILDTVPGDKRHAPGVEAYCSTRAAVQVVLERAEQVIEELAAEVQRRAPQITHVTIEVEGIATPPGEPWG